MRACPSLLCQGLHRKALPIQLIQRFDYTLSGYGCRMTRRALFAVGLGVLFGSARKAFAHHSTAMYDRDYKPLFGAK